MRNDVTTKYLFTICALLLLASASFDAASDEVLLVEEDDAEMLVAISKSRSLLPHFWETFENPTKGEQEFSLKVKIADENGVEHFWVVDLNRKDDRLTGTINNDPQIVTSVSFGERITFADSDISDWVYIRGEKMVGNYTLRVLFRQMSADEVAFYRQILDDP